MRDTTKWVSYTIPSKKKNTYYIRAVFVVLLFS